MSRRERRRAARERAFSRDRLAFMTHFRIIEHEKRMTHAFLDETFVDNVSVGGQRPNWRRGF
jgi:hypothetical protein